jgi:hypothetical protein
MTIFQARRAGGSVTIPSAHRPPRVLARNAASGDGHQIVDLGQQSLASASTGPEKGCARHRTRSRRLGRGLQSASPPGLRGSGHRTTARGPGVQRFLRGSCCSGDASQVPAIPCLVRKKQECKTSPLHGRPVARCRALARGDSLQGCTQRSGRSDWQAAARAGNAGHAKLAVAGIRCMDCTPSGCFGMLQDRVQGSLVQRRCKLTLNGTVFTPAACRPCSRPLPRRPMR